MKATSYLLFLTLLYAVFSSCTKKTTVNPTKVGDTVVNPYASAHVYVVGSGPAPTGLSATCWVDGTPQYLSDNTPQSIANSIVIQGSDVYEAGWTNALYGADIAAYWKNGVETQLTSCGKVSQANGIAVSGNDIYVAGVVYNTNGLHQAVYWKNGVMTALTDSNTVAKAFAIAVSGQDVYIAGYMDNSAVYWKNGVSYTLNPDPSMDPALYSAIANSVNIIGNDLYFAGSIATYSTIGIVSWKNGIATQYHDGTICSISQTAGAMFTNGQDVYLAGYTKDPKTLKAIATYWKNGVEKKITDGTTNAEADAITANGSDVYISGLLNGNATLWKNGSPVQLNNTSSPTATTGIIVVPK